MPRGSLLAKAKGKYGDKKKKLTSQNLVRSTCMQGLYNQLKTMNTDVTVYL